MKKLYEDSVARATPCHETFSYHELIEERKSEETTRRKR